MLARMAFLVDLHFRGSYSFYYTIRILLLIFHFFSRTLSENPSVISLAALSFNEGALHKVCHSGEGDGGSGKKLTKCDMGGGGQNLIEPIFIFTIFNFL